MSYFFYIYLNPETQNLYPQSNINSVNIDCLSSKSYPHTKTPFTDLRLEVNSNVENSHRSLGSDPWSAGHACWFLYPKAKRSVKIWQPGIQQMRSINKHFTSSETLISFGNINSTFFRTQPLLQSWHNQAGSLFYAKAYLRLSYMRYDTFWT